MKISLVEWFRSRGFVGARRAVKKIAAGAAIVGSSFAFVGSAQGIEAIVNGSFELPSPTGWQGGFGVYDHSTQVYYEGPAPAGSGQFYGWDPGIVAPQVATQTLNLSAGIGQIDSGTASYDFSAWLASWTSDDNYTILDLEWNDSTSGNGNSLGAVVFDGNDEFNPNIVGSADANGLADPGVPWTQDNWSLYQSVGTIPVGARSAIVTYTGEGNDAYLDLVSLDLPFSINSPTLEVFVSRDSGQIEIQNNTGVDQDIKGYSIVSEDGALLEANATFLADGDPNWIQLTESGGNYDLSEGHLTTFSFGVGSTIDLGNSWLQYYEDETDVTFEYLDGQGLLVEGIVQFTGNNDASFAFGDLDFDGDVDSDDWLQFASGLGDSFSNASPAGSYRLGDLTGDLVSDHADFLAFEAAYDAANGAGAFQRDIVPEPSTGLISIVLLGVAAVAARQR